ncbi:MAG TPA: hypothetical protein PKC98_18605, partial [Candidatus Melainabacteria bacterium]|nr:hypothetical protein [Candidatus Melainabacteria bacterium]
LATGYQSIRSARAINSFNNLMTGRNLLTFGRGDSGTSAFVVFDRNLPDINSGRIDWSQRGGRLDLSGGYKTYVDSYKRNLIDSSPEFNQLMAKAGMMVRIGRSGKPELIPFTDGKTGDSGEEMIIPLVDLSTKARAIGYNRDITRVRDTELYGALSLKDEQTPAPEFKDFLTNWLANNPNVAKVGSISDKLQDYSGAIQKGLVIPETTELDLSSGLDVRYPTSSAAKVIAFENPPTAWSNQYTLPYDGKTSNYYDPQRRQISIDIMNRQYKQYRSSNLDKLLESNLVESKEPWSELLKWRPVGEVHLRRPEVLEKPPVDDMSNLKAAKLVGIDHLIPDSLVAPDRKVYVSDLVKYLASTKEAGGRVLFVKGLNDGKLDKFTLSPQAQQQMNQIALLQYFNLLRYEGLRR